MKNKKAFTLAEMMVVLLIISLAVAAFMPIMTKRAKSSSSSGGNANNIWQYVSDTDKDIYAITDNTLGAIIGATSFAAGDNARLMINTSGLGQADILMKQSGNQTGILVSDGNGNVGLGNVSFDATPPTKSNQISIGNNTQTQDNNQIAMGNSAKALASSSSAIALGNSATSASDSSVAIGHNSLANGSDSIALGTSANVKTGSSNSLTEAIAIGAFTKADGYQNVAIGPFANATSSVDSDPALALGESAKASGRNTLALGSQSKALHSMSTAIGVDATTTADHQIVLGTATDTVYIPGQLHIGNVNRDPSTVTGGWQSMAVAPDSAKPWGWLLFRSGCDSIGACSANPSDKRLKNIKGPSVAGLDKIRKLKPFNYTFKKDKAKTPRVGVMAQDLKLIFPNAVIKGPDGYLMIRQEDMFYAMVNSIKQLDVITQGLIKDFKSLVARVQTLDDRIIALIKVDQINGKKIKELELKNKLLEKQNKTFEIRLKKLEKK